MKILVAEDEIISRELIIRILENLGHEVRIFPDGGSALAAFKENPAGVDVIFSDWMMPGLDGLEFCRTVRRTPAKNYVYFILATAGRTTEADHDAAVSAGVDDFLIKPIQGEEVRRRLFVAKRILEFNQHLKQIKSLLPACLYCHKLREDNNYWQNFENYIQEHPDDNSSNYICPECYEKQLGPAADGSGGSHHH